MYNWLYWEMRAALVRITMRSSLAGSECIYVCIFLVGKEKMLLVIIGDNQMGKEYNRCSWINIKQWLQSWETVVQDCSSTRTYHDMSIQFEYSHMTR